MVNQTFKRNIKRFVDGFKYQITKKAPNSESAETNNFVFVQQSKVFGAGSTVGTTFPSFSRGHKKTMSDSSSHTNASGGGNDEDQAMARFQRGHRKGMNSESMGSTESLFESSASALEVRYTVTVHRFEFKT